MTVGTRASGATLAEHWNGKKWSAVATKSYGLLAGVSCPATRNCTAVGSNSAGKALAEHWNGKAWSDPPTASSRRSISDLPACPAARRAPASRSARAARPAVPPPHPIAEQWTGGELGGADRPGPVPGRVAELNSVSCISATNCMAVGDVDERGRHHRHDRGRALGWHVLDGRDRAEPGDVQRPRSRCRAPRPAHCVAVGAE